MTSLRRALLGVFVVGLAAVGLASAAPTSSKAIRFSFEGYANHIRVVPPLVGKWQLGVAKIRGSGSLAPGDLRGTFYDTDDPKLSQYEPRWLRARVIGYRYTAQPHGGEKKLILTVEITSSSHPDDECAPGVRGLLTLIDSNERLSNGENSDAIYVASQGGESARWTGKCNTHVHGWNNTDGGRRTDPARGGPGGGQWAAVNIKS